MTLPDDIRDSLREQIQHYAAHRCIQLAPADTLADSDALDIPGIRLDPHFDIEQTLSALPGRVGLAIVIDAPRVSTRQATARLLGRLRNYDASAIVAAFHRGDARRLDRWSIGDFLGLGFRRFRPSTRVESDYWLYRYDIYDYKITPDWLNARHWANPEQWGKHRW